ncbi:MAG: hypothetical protein ACRD3J_28070 [Thermoanaerobaculia bacterium]
MADLPVRDRKFNEEEVALIIKRAAELQQTQQVEQEPSTALTLSEVEQIAREAGIDPLLIRQAAHGLDRPTEPSRPSAWLGAPTRLVFERVVDGEIPVDDFEPLINEIRRTFGDNGLPGVIGRTLAWSSSNQAGRRRQGGRLINVSVVSRGGVTTIRVEEELRNLAGALFGGLVGGGGGGSTGMSIGIGLGVFHSFALAAGLWVAVAGGFYTLARSIFSRVAIKREAQLRELTGRLEEQITESAASRALAPGDAAAPAPKV